MQLEAAEGRITKVEECDCLKSCSINGSVYADGANWQRDCEMCACVVSIHYFLCFIIMNLFNNFLFIFSMVRFNADLFNVRNLTVKNLIPILGSVVQHALVSDIVLILNLFYFFIKTIFFVYNDDLHSN